MELYTLKQEINLRKAWPNEAIDFTPWLAKHLSYVGDILDLELELVEKESIVGEYKRDIQSIYTDFVRKLNIKSFFINTIRLAEDFAEIEDDSYFESCTTNHRL